ncbi:S-adenosyl-L-methionine dependent methyltransferase [Vibrio maritimus]|uniref:S-adenosyl-L-methionine dependent methyltransferase n=1 Tax=Vibrio maritimus TaxID=990268 RepID=A0A090S373_9VIBR|nr:S-adenosyl-L-methionine dependent methyltransferase [Vibrio maritimus]
MPIAAKTQGLMAIQAITIADQRYDYYSDNVDFIQKYIFPGGFLPSITALTANSTKHTDLIVRDLFDIGQDYAKRLSIGDIVLRTLSLESVSSAMTSALLECGAITSATAKAGLEPRALAQFTSRFSVANNDGQLE